ncbi:PEBP-like protein [Hypoxylon cercidicola]|nr:PEBP-like protein [Hypoxylon cercidicola]
MSLADLALALNTSLSDAGLVPGPASALIPEGFQPTTRVAVAFGDKAADLGTFFRARECAGAPRVSVPPELASESESGSDLSYTLILADPDAPTPDDPKYAFWRHYVVGGLKPESGQGRVLTAYLGPGPKDDSKPHRYLFLLYREPAGLALAKDDVGGEEFVQRRSFRPAEFAARHGLRLVGVNWMTCAGDGWKE